MKIRLAAAVCAAKFAILVCRLTGSRASALPGKVAPESAARALYAAITKPEI